MNNKTAFVVPDDDRIKELVSRMVEAEQAIRAYLGDDVDAVVDPLKGSLILLKQAQEALLEEVRYYHVANILQNMKDSIIVTDSDGIITYWNDGASSIHGQKAEDAVGKPLWQLPPDGYYQELREALMNLPQEDVIQREWHTQAEDDSGLWVESRISLMRNAKGETTGYILVERDISERKRAHEALKASEERLRQLSAELMNAQENERKAIAGDLHDGLAANLSAILFTLENKIGEMNNGKTGADPVKLEDVAEMIRRSIEDTRRIMTNLRPAILDDLGILSTLEWFCRDFGNVYRHIGIEKKIQIVEHEIPNHLRTPIFRVLQEAMHNVVKHSKATKVKISLRKYKGEILLKIQDNGRGFDTGNMYFEKDASHGLGLHSMRERAECSGGSFGIESVIGLGTKIHASWPLG